MGRRRRKKDPSGIDVIFAIMGLIVFLVFANNISGGVSSIDSIVSKLLTALTWGVVGLVVIGIMVLFIRSKHAIARPMNFIENIASSGKSESIPTEWSEELISNVEWRVFEKLCFGLWRAKGFNIEETDNGADGGVDFYLCTPESGARITAVQCKSWKAKQIDVKVVRELQGVVASEKLRLGLLMYSGVLSKAAQDFSAKPDVTIKTRGADDILAQIRQLSEQAQSSLLHEITRGDYLTPSCPNCDVKLVEKIGRKTNNKFMACPNFPSCRYTLNSR